MSDEKRRRRAVKSPREERPSEGLRADIYDVIFEADTKFGKAFDVILLWAIAASVLVVMLESVEAVRSKFGFELHLLEWGFTILFSIEYLLRLYSVKKPHYYAFSFFGIVDLLSILPTYLSLVFAGAQMFLIIRVLRLLRIFRIFKLSRYLGEASVLVKALASSRRKIIVFLGSVLSLVLIMGSLMYLVEGPEHGFTSIPRSIYWAIVTLTTVGYGDIAPQTAFGQALSSFVMIMGYSIIAVPTGIMTVELSQVYAEQGNAATCAVCNASNHPAGANYCHVCGTRIRLPRA